MKNKVKFDHVPTLYCDTYPTQKNLGYNKLMERNFKRLTTFYVRFVVLRIALTPYHHDVAPLLTFTS